MSFWDAGWDAGWKAARVGMDADIATAIRFKEGRQPMTEQPTPTHDEVVRAIERIDAHLASGPVESMEITNGPEFAALLHAARIGAKLMAPGAREEIAEIICNADANGHDPFMWENRSTPEREYFRNVADAILARFTQEHTDGA